jgi:molecular chaperone Hsp33
MAGEPDLLWRVTAGEGRVRAIFVRATHLVESARRRHGLSPVAAAALGRTMTAAVMLAATLKAGEHVTVRVLGDGPLGAVVADADGRGGARGYVQTPKLLLPLKTDGKLDVARAVGRGTFSVSREFQGRIYSSSVELVSGEIGVDFAHYLRESEQVPSAVSLGVHVDRRGRVAAAGGILLQLLPGGEEFSDLLSERLTGFGAVSQALKDGATPESMAAAVLGDLHPTLLEERPLRFRCGCSRARSRRALLALGAEELRALLEEKGEAEVRCHFCNKTYHIGPEELRRLLTAATAKSGR